MSIVTEMNKENVIYYTNNLSIQKLNILIFKNMIGNNVKSYIHDKIEIKNCPLLLPISIRYLFEYKDAIHCIVNKKIILSMPKNRNFFDFNEKFFSSRVDENIEYCHVWKNILFIFCTNRVLMYKNHEFFETLHCWKHGHNLFIDKINYKINDPKLFYNLFFNWFDYFYVSLNTFDFDIHKHNIIERWYTANYIFKRTLTQILKNIYQHHKIVQFKIVHSNETNLYIALNKHKLVVVNYLLGNYLFSVDISNFYRNSNLFFLDSSEQNSSTILIFAEIFPNYIFLKFFHLNEHTKTLYYLHDYTYYYVSPIKPENFVLIQKIFEYNNNYFIEYNVSCNKTFCQFLFNCLQKNNQIIEEMIQYNLLISKKYKNLDSILSGEPKFKPDEKKDLILPKCVICFENNKAVLFLPCNHLCCCYECHLKHNFETCPICRTKIISKRTIFF